MLPILILFIFDLIVLFFEYLSLGKDTPLIFIFMISSSVYCVFGNLDSVYNFKENLKLSSFWLLDFNLYFRFDSNVALSYYLLISKYNLFLDWNLSVSLHLGKMKASSRISLIISLQWFYYFDFLTLYSIFLISLILLTHILWFH